VTFIQKKERAKKKNKQLTILNITDELWNEIKSIFPKEKPLKTVGSRPIIPYRKVIDGIIYVLRTGCQWKNATQRIRIGVLPVIADFSNGIVLIYSKRDGSEY
jgi:hypothetical protein